MNNSVYDKTMENLTLIWMGFLGTRIKLDSGGGGGGGGGGGAKITPSLKLVIIMLCYKLEIWYVTTNRYKVSENVSFSTRAS